MQSIIDRFLILFFYVAVMLNFGVQLSWKKFVLTILLFLLAIRVVVVTLKLFTLVCIVQPNYVIFQHGNHNTKTIHRKLNFDVYMCPKVKTYLRNE